MGQIYHLAWSRDWERQDAFGRYVAPSLQSEGFLHATREWEQLAEVLRLFFAGPADDELLLVTIDEEKVEAEVRYEDPGVGHLFPHIYGPLNRDAILVVQTLARDENGWRLPPPPSRL